MGIKQKAHSSNLKLDGDRGAELGDSLQAQIFEREQWEQTSRVQISTRYLSRPHIEVTQLSHTKGKVKTMFDVYEARSLERIRACSLEPEYFVEYEFQLDYDLEEIRTSGQTAFIGTKQEFQEALDFVSRFRLQSILNKELPNSLFMGDKPKCERP